MVMSFTIIKQYGTNCIIRDHGGLGFLVQKYHSKTSLSNGLAVLGIATPKMSFRSILNPSNEFSGISN